MATTAAGKTFIKAGLLLDGSGADPVPNPVVVVEGDRIVNVTSGPLADQVDGTVIDLGDKTLMPGMCDAHVHLSGVRGMGPAESIVPPHDLLVLRAAEDCRKMLMAGFTSTRDCGSTIGLSLARAEKEGILVAPHIWASGKVITQTGGHADVHFLPVEAVRNDPDAVGRLADGPDECRRSAREVLRSGADFIKICTSGGVGSEKDHPLDEHYTIPEIQAITEEAHRAGRRVATHAQGAPGVKNAIRAGVDTVEHGYFLDDEAIDLMLEHGTYFVPTIALIEVFRTGMERPADLPPWRRKKQPECIAAMEVSFPKAYRAGVKMAAGTDYFGPPLRAHGDNADEPITMVKMGMSARDAIRAVTLGGAECIGWEKDYGTVAKGKVADIIAINGNPLADIGLLKSGVSFVMKAGTVYRND